MKKSQLAVKAFMVLLALLCLVSDVNAKKKKHKKRKKYKTTSVARSNDSLRVVRAPGVVNQHEHDSLKAAKGKMKRDSIKVLRNQQKANH